MEQREDESTREGQLSGKPEKEKDGPPTNNEEERREEMSKTNEDEVTTRGEKKVTDKEEEERAKLTEKFIIAEMRAERKKKKREQVDRLAIKREADVRELIEKYESEKVQKCRNEKKLATCCTNIIFELCKHKADKLEKYGRAEVYDSSEIEWPKEITSRLEALIEKEIETEMKRHSEQQDADKEKETTDDETEQDSEVEDILASLRLIKRPQEKDKEKYRNAID